MMNSFKAASRMLVGMILVLAMLVTMSLTGHCSIPTHNNSLGVLIYQENPYTYVLASIEDVNFIKDNANQGVNLHLQPAHTYLLYTEELLVCSATSEALEGLSLHQLVVLTYEKTVHRTIQGVGCHRLISVDVIAAKKSK